MTISLAADFTCGKCKGPLAAAERFCPACGADRDLEIQIEALERTKLASARKWILGIGIWYLVSGLIMLAIVKDQLTPEGRVLLLGTHLGLFVVHVGLYVWARVAPLAAAVVSLVLFLTLHLANAVLEPSSIYKGMIVKVLFIVVLVKAIQAGYEIHRLRNERS
ncbi:MAG: hypothetical protein HS111_37110 [Kofleriaceae bacterium]|nr:hypothetical protein [Kofleriaceae bacterium]MCL4224291.1 hypothetical protein [Myxococcales bacterium]